MLIIGRSGCFAVTLHVYVARGLAMWGRENSAGFCLVVRLGTQSDWITTQLLLTGAFITILISHSPTWYW